MSETATFLTGSENVVDTTTPPDAEMGHDWRREPWVREVSRTATELGLLITAAFAADGDDDQDEEDCIVRLLVNPQLANMVIRSIEADDIIRYRVAHAVAMLIDRGVKAALAAQRSFDPEPIFGDDAAKGA